MNPLIFVLAEEIALGTCDMCPEQRDAVETTIHGLNLCSVCIEQNVVIEA